MTMNRRLVIITNDGGRQDYLAGVKVDKSNYIKYFKSPAGGAWEEKEMLVPKTDEFTPSLFKLYVQEQEAIVHIDYWLIVFCGHGGINGLGETFFDFYNDNLIGEIEIRNMFINSRCLLIADSCRSLPLLEDGGRLDERNFSMIIGDRCYRNQCRELYNSQIMKIPSGAFFRGYAASPDQSALEQENGLGGKYSYNLLSVAVQESNVLYLQHLKNQFLNEHVISFSYIHEKAAKQVNKETKGMQLPVYYSPRVHQPPFCVIP